MAARKNSLIIIAFILLTVNPLPLLSQDNALSLSAGKVTDSDTTIIHPAHFSHYFITRCIFNDQYSDPLINEFSGPMQFSDISDYDTYRQVMKSIAQDLRRNRPQNLTFAARMMSAVAQMFCKSPDVCPEGYMRMSETGPLRTIFMKIPGHAPDVIPVGQENAPVCVKLEYDASSGHYKEAIVEWEEVRK